MNTLTKLRKLKALVKKNKDRRQTESFIHLYNNSLIYIDKLIDARAKITHADVTILNNIYRNFSTPEVPEFMEKYLNKPNQNPWVGVKFKTSKTNNRIFLMKGCPHNPEFCITIHQISPKKSEYGNGAVWNIRDLPKMFKGQDKWIMI